MVSSKEASGIHRSPALKKRSLRSKMVMKSCSSWLAMSLVPRQLEAVRANLEQRTVTLEGRARLHIVQGGAR